jgi:hypothetical protein
MGLQSSKQQLKQRAYFVTKTLLVDIPLKILVDALD